MGNVLLGASSDQRPGLLHVQVREARVRLEVRHAVYVVLTTTGGSATTTSAVGVGRGGLAVFNEERLVVVHDAATETLAVELKTRHSNSAMDRPLTAPVKLPLRSLPYSSRQELSVACNCFTVTLQVRLSSPLDLLWKGPSRSSFLPRPVSP
eukprot:RCo046380